MIERLGSAAMFGIERQQRQAATARLGFGGLHQPAAEPLPPRPAVHQQLLYIGAVFLVRRRVQPQHHGAKDDAIVAAHHDQHGAAVAQGRQLALPEGARGVHGKGLHEIDAGAMRHAVVQDFGQRIQFGVGRRSIQNGNSHV